MDPIELRHSEELDTFLSEFGSKSRIKRDSACSIRSRSRSRKNSLNDRNIEQQALSTSAPLATGTGGTSTTTIATIGIGSNNSIFQKQNNNNNIWRSQEFRRIQIVPPPDHGKVGENGQVNKNDSEDLVDHGEGGHGQNESDRLNSGCNCGRNGGGDRDRDRRRDRECDCSIDMVEEESVSEDAEDDDGDDEKNKDKSSNKFTGLILALVSCVAFSLSSLIVKYLKEYHPFSKSVWRFQGLVVPAIPMMLYSYKYNREPIFETVWPVCQHEKLRNILYLMLRSTAGFATIILQFYSLQYITLADQMVLGSSQPVFVGIVAYFMLGEKCGFVPVFICILTVIGVFIVAKPPILSGADTFDEGALIGSALAMGSVMMSVMSIVFMRKMKDIHFTLITFSFGIYSTVVSLIFAFAMNVFQLPHGQEHIILAVILACLVFASQTCTTIALKHEQAGPVSLTRTSNIIFGYMWQYIFLGVLPDSYSIVGASIIFFGVVLIAIRKWVSTLPKDHSSRKRFAFMMR